MFMHYCVARATRPCRTADTPAFGCSPEASRNEMRPSEYLEFYRLGPHAPSHDDRRSRIT